MFFSDALAKNPLCKDMHPQEQDKFIAWNLIYAKDRVNKRKAKQKKKKRKKICKAASRFQNHKFFSGIFIFFCMEVEFLFLLSSNFLVSFDFLLLVKTI